MNEKRKTEHYSIEEDDSSISTEDTIVSQGKQLALHEKKIKNIKTRQDEIEKRQRALVEYGYHTISKFAKYYGVNLLESDKQILDEKVRVLCNQRELGTGKEPEGLLMVDSYPYPVLVEVFQEFTSSNSN